MTSVDTPLGTALRAAMKARGLTVGDLADDTGIDRGAIRNLLSGRVRCPREREVRDALDDYFAPGLRGRTLDICRGDVDGYPSRALAELVQAATKLGDDDDRLEPITTILRSMGDDTP